MPGRILIVRQRRFTSNKHPPPRHFGSLRIARQQAGELRNQRLQDSLGLRWNQEMEPLADWFAEQLEETVRIYAKEMQADLIVPVPLHKIRRRERGFNQAELLSKRVAKRLGIPHEAVPAISASQAWDRSHR